MKERYQSPASRGWGQVAPALYPHLARIEEVGPLGGRIDNTARRANTDGPSGDTSVMAETQQQSQEEQTSGDSLISNMDCVLLLGLLLLSAGLIVTFLFIPVPNNWLINHDLVYMGGAVTLLGATTFLGGIIPCICNHFFKKCCKTPVKPQVLKTKRVEQRKIIKVRESPAEKTDDKEELITDVYNFQ